MCLNHICILMYWYTRCNYKLWKIPWFYSVFFWLFSYIIDDHSCLIFCMSNKLSHIMSLINVNIWVCMSTCQMWLQVIEDYLHFLGQIFDFKYGFLGLVGNTALYLQKNITKIILNNFSRFFSSQVQNFIQFLFSLN